MPADRARPRRAETVKQFSKAYGGTRKWPCRRRPTHADAARARRAEIVAASVDGTVRCFDVRAGCLTTDELATPVSAAALSHDGNCVLAACLDSRLRLLDRGSGTLLAQYTGALLWRVLHRRIPFDWSVKAYQQRAVLLEYSGGGALCINLHRIKLPGGQVGGISKQIPKIVFLDTQLMRCNVAYMWCLSIMYEVKK